MNSKILAGLLVLCALIVGLVVIIGNTTEEQPEDAESSIQQEAVDMSEITNNLIDTIQDVIARQSDPNVIVLDVRTDAEWNEQHAVDAIHWGLVEHLQNDELPELDKDAEIYVYCRSGNRSGQAIRIMQEAGFTNLTNIGGLDDWLAAGGETTSGIDGSDQ